MATNTRYEASIEPYDESCCIKYPLLAVCAYEHRANRVRSAKKLKLRLREVITLRRAKFGPSVSRKVLKSFREDQHISEIADEENSENDKSDVN